MNLSRQPPAEDDGHSSGPTCPFLLAPCSSTFRDPLLHGKTLGLHSGPPSDPQTPTGQGSGQLSEATLKAGLLEACGSTSCLATGPNHQSRQCLALADPWAGVGLGT